MNTTPPNSAMRAAEDEDAFNDWNRDVTDYVPSLWDAYVFGLNRARAERDKEVAGLVAALRAWTEWAENQSVPFNRELAAQHVGMSRAILARYPQQKESHD